MRTHTWKQALLGLTLLILTFGTQTIAHAEFEEYRGTEIHVMYLCLPSAIEELKKVAEIRAEYGPRISNDLLLYLIEEGECSWVQISLNLTVAFSKVLKSWLIDDGTRTALLVETKGKQGQLSYGLWIKEALEKELKEHAKRQSI